MKQTLNDFASNTTAHGWGNIHQRTTTLSKAVWIILCLGCTGVAIWQVITIVIRYGLFETKDRIQVEEGDITFPSVTVCPLVGIPKSENSKLLKDLYNGKIDADTYAEMLAFDTQIVYSSIYLDSNISQNAYREKLEFHNVFSKQLFSFQGYIENFNIFRDYSHKQEEFIPICRYQGKPCLKSDFQSLDHHEHNKCYTFNGANNTISNPSTNITGPKGGLSLVLFVDASEASQVYNPDYPTSGSQGVRVVIHEKGTFPDPENDGFDIEPGHSVNAALSVNQRQLLKPPWGKCANYDAEVYGGFTYRKKLCQLSCTQRFIYKTCGCIKSSLPVDEVTAHKEYCLKIHPQEWLKLNSSQYNLTIIQNDLEKLRCQNREYPSSDILAQDGCQCREKCMYHTYDMTLSQAEWPMRGVEITFYCRLIMTADNYINSSIYDTFHNISEYCDFAKPENESKILRERYGDTLRQNFIRLNVYFKDLEMKVIKQAEDFTINSMISEIGGSLGFFVGMSIITIAEIFLLCWNITGVLKNRVENRVVSTPHQENKTDQKSALERANRSNAWEDEKSIKW
ncbi:unnamed protein product [Owenia fusiformis]|uniref:Uncharacterized protein n=1 Tax=Owenia fusiformis TaxID=6347 RepID=A0A8J1UWL3_OWEFU|nr:unnamed protein product [Owenia fusiformis]